MSAKVVGVQTFSAASLVTEQKLTNDPAKPISHVDIYVEGGDIRWTDVASDTLSSSVGTVLAAGKTMRYDADFKNLRMIASGATTPTVRVHKYASSHLA